MDKERLLVLSFDALRDIARRSGIDFVDGITKTSLVDQILDVLAETRMEREVSNNIEMLVKEKKFELNPDESLENYDLEEHRLPESYGETRIVLMLRDPSWAFAYWDIGNDHLEFTRESEDTTKLILRVCEGEIGPDWKSDRFFDIPVRGNERKRYINLPRKGRAYVVELIATSHSVEHVLCRSAVVSSPETTIDDIESANEMEYAGILSAAGIQQSGEGAFHGGIPQRIISLLDSQYLHLKG